MHHLEELRSSAFDSLQVDLVRRTSSSVLANGSLLLQPLSKDHQGVWECVATNRVAAVKTSTHIFVLGEWQINNKSLAAECKFKSIYHAFYVNYVNFLYLTICSSKCLSNVAVHSKKRILIFFLFSKFLVDIVLLGARHTFEASASDPPPTVKCSTSRDGLYTL